MSGHDPGNPEVDLYNDTIEDNLAPPGWPLYLPTRQSLDYLEQALTEDGNGLDGLNLAFDRSSTVVINQEGHYVWSWPENSIQAAVVQGRQPHLVMLPSDNGGANNALGSQQYTVALAYGPPNALPYRSEEELEQAFARAYAPRDSPSVSLPSGISPFMGQYPAGSMNVLARPGPGCLHRLPPEQPTIDPQLLTLPSPIGIAEQGMHQHVQFPNSHIGPPAGRGRRPNVEAHVNHLQLPPGGGMRHQDAKVRNNQPRSPSRRDGRAIRGPTCARRERPPEGRMMATLRSRAVYEEWERLNNTQDRLVVTIRSRAACEAWERLNNHGQGS
ncbi:hypothetical protein M406DRAFT_70060 [Cryphonectria parasitica EP155]|uniref:Uncharacterized protein n=1 Tax=Cryphonectria parasitica (strain ATCC 38755 / EP155) TaxID=660469 RepID=A0A9P5CR72_CRYP1|nr:uncharacterized protein M406DRAFT_70060 [Cryphonectria parasitica EP155]KAF3767958.1 hypothetical protein M406DRAFT_70060 [Cryphonectria parasitica EP155]